MNRADCYDHMAQIFSYPWQKAPLESSVACLLDLGVVSLEGLAAFLAVAPLGVVQEEYVLGFDLNPRCAPYVGHHLYGEHRMRAEYLIRLKELYREHDFEAPLEEPPDHFEVMYRFAARLCRTAGEATAREFLAEYLLDGARRLLQAAQAQDAFPWSGAVAAAVTICAVECEEVRHA